MSVADAVLKAFLDAYDENNSFLGVYCYCIKRCYHVYIYVCIACHINTVYEMTQHSKEHLVWIWYFMAIKNIRQYTESACHPLPLHWQSCCDTLKSAVQFQRTYMMLPYLLKWSCNCLDNSYVERVCELWKKRW